MRKTVLFAVIAFLAGCSGRRQPDEFSVTSNPPLTYPPSYSAQLPAPQEKKTTPESGDPDNQAARSVREILSGKAKADEPKPKADKPRFNLDATPADKEFIEKF